MVMARLNVVMSMLLYVVSRAYADLSLNKIMTSL
jgi:hypothetical protein